LEVCYLVVVEEVEDVFGLADARVDTVPMRAPVPIGAAEKEGSETSTPDVEIAIEQPKDTPHGRVPERVESPIPWYSLRYYCYSQ
jgi:hypothetical protein